MTAQAAEELPVVASIIAGRATEGSRALPLINPANGRGVGTLRVADLEVVTAAVAAAKAAFPAWRDTPPSRRARILLAFREILEREKEELARVIMREHGKPVVDALASIQRGTEVVEFAAGASHLLKGESSDFVAAGVATRSSRRPLGVCVGISPYNYPAMIPMWMFPMSLICGNTFVLKPSERTPSAANKLADMLTRAGLPDGVLNVVHGGREVASMLISHPDVAAVSFVGSSAAAKQVYEVGTKCGKRVQALGGAKNHAIVMPDAKIEHTVESIVNGAFNSAGQRCMAISVVVTVAGAHEKLMPLLVERSKAVKVAGGDDPDCYVPPLSFAEHYQKVLKYIEDGEAGGAQLVLDRRDAEAARNSGGYFIGPVIFDRVRPEMRIYRDEIFGPVLSVMNVADLDEAIRITNSHPLANGAVLFTTSGVDAYKFEQEIVCGMPGVNVGVPSPVAFYSFGGNKGSMFGDLAVHGPDSVRFYTRTQVLTSRWI